MTARAVMRRLRARRAASADREELLADRLLVLALRRTVVRAERLMRAEVELSGEAWRFTAHDSEV